MTNTFTTSAAELLELKEKIKYLKDKEKALLEQLKTTCNYQTTLCNGYKFELIERKGLIQYSKIEALKAIDLEPYRGNPINAWKLSYRKQFDI